MIVLYMLYSAIFPRFFSLTITRKAEASPVLLSELEGPCTVRPNVIGECKRLEGIGACIYLNWYMPIFRPVTWWGHMAAVNELLEAIGWIDLDQ